MSYWITNHIATIVVAIILTILLVLVIRYVIKNKKRGNSSCGYNCDACPYASGGCSNRKTE